jgi:ectoine hydroxylase-related dioxygenase (phytanoyl-CoA dioxygenase family)
MTLRRLPANAPFDDIVDSLDEVGYALLERFLPDDEVAAKRAAIEDVLTSTPTGRNDFEGFHTQRVYALFAKTRAFDDAALNPTLLATLDRVLGNYQFSAPVAIHIGPDETAQVLHRDEDIYPLPRPHDEVVFNTMWALCDFTEANGATRLVPGSHRWEPDRWPEEGEAVAAEMPAGSVLFYRGSLWHGGGANRTDRPRLGVILEFAASWLRPQETHLLAVPPAVAATLPERLQELLGYNIHPPFLGYVDGRHPRRFLPQAADRG